MIVSYVCTLELAIVSCTFVSCIFVYPPVINFVYLYNPYPIGNISCIFHVLFVYIIYININVILIKNNILKIYILTFGLSDFLLLYYSLLQLCERLSNWFGKLSGVRDFDGLVCMCKGQNIGDAIWFNIFVNCLVENGDA